MTRTWFITGVSSGLGRLMAERLLARSERVVGTVRRPDAVDDLRAAYGERLRLVTLDVTDGAAVRAAVDDAFARAGRIDVVVNNAGYGLFGAAEEVTDAQIEHQLATNLVGSMRVIRAALPHLRRQGGGRIIQVSSEGGQIAYPSFSVYHASKWGIEGFIEAAAQEVAPFGIEFSIVEPGPTGTQFGVSLVRAAPLPVYDGTPVGALRRAVADGSFVIRGDAQRTANAIIDAVDAARLPRRLVLGGAAYTSISAALAQRLAELEAQRELAFSADR